MQRFKNVPFVQSSTREGFMVQFNIWGDYMSTSIYNFCEPIYMKTKNFWDATIFPLDWEDGVRSRLEKDPSWKDYGSFKYIYVTYTETEKIVFSSKNKDMV